VKERPTSKGTRKELIRILRERYGSSTKSEKGRILDEFVGLTGFHRKHAIQLLGRPLSLSGGRPHGRPRVYEEAVKEALIVLWEASDRICGKRLKLLIPILVGYLERHGHLNLAPPVRALVLSVCPATIDRMLAGIKVGADQRKPIPKGQALLIRRQIPVRTFADWGSPAPGFMEVDLVCHGGPTSEGAYIHSLVLTDIATGWTECIALVIRSADLIVKALDHVAALLPFPVGAIDVDNGSECMNQTLLDCCRGKGIQFTRARPFHKNDQAWVEQKNGALVRRLLGYERLEGMETARVLGRLYSAFRLYNNFFQPSFKLASRERQGARVTKHYHAPATPCERLLGGEGLPDSVKAELRQRALELDPIRLLAAIRRGQKQTKKLSSPGAEESHPPETADLEAFLQGLSSLWREPGPKPARRKYTWHKPREEWGPMGRRRSLNLQGAWPQIVEWLEAEPECSAAEILRRLQAKNPDLFPRSLLRSLMRWVKEWRIAEARRLVYGEPMEPAKVPASDEA